MPKGLKDETPAPASQEQLSEHMRTLGAKGGKVSGAKRMEMSEKQRQAIARKAAAARWTRACIGVAT
jgi:hypothetical protein